MSERERAEATTARLRALWQSSLPGLRSRIGLLDAAAEAARTDRLTEPERLEASATAHKLAGLLGTFGYPDGTTVARQIEAALTRAEPEADALMWLVQRLRQVLPLEG